MDRRAFLRLIGGAAAVAAAAPAIPFGRVWSFPSKIVIPQSDEILKRNFVSIEIMREHERDRAFLAGAAWPVGTRVPIRFPQRYAVAGPDAGIYDANGKRLD